jgi:hypothetical protein
MWKRREKIPLPVHLCCCVQCKGVQKQDRRQLRLGRGGKGFTCCPNFCACTELLCLLYPSSAMM